MTYWEMIEYAIERGAAGSEWLVFAALLVVIGLPIMIVVFVLSFVFRRQ